MRFRELRLEAFGPFTDQLIDFGSGHEADLHVILGRNEAGKSSTLRAIDALLYGIPARTSDDFVHAYARLRIGAVLQGAGAQSLTFTRVKGNKDTLLDAAGTPLADGPLQQLLGGVGRDDFRRLYLLTGTMLAAGGESLLAGGGEFGVSIFGATLGSSDLPGAMRRLRERADAIYKTSGRLPPLNAALAAYRNHLSDAKTLAVAPQAFSEADALVARTEAERESQRAAVTALEQRVQTLRRLSSVTAPFARRLQLQAELAAYREVPELPPDAASRRELASAQQRRSERSLAESETRRRRLQTEIGELARDRPELGGGDGTVTVQALTGVQTELIATLSDEFLKLQTQLASAEQQLEDRRAAYERRLQASAQAAPGASTATAASASTSTAAVELARWTQALEDAAPRLIAAGERQRESEAALATTLRAAAALAPPLSAAELSELELPAEAELTAQRDAQQELALKRSRCVEEIEQRRTEIENERLALTGSGSDQVQQTRAELDATRAQRDSQLASLGETLDAATLQRAREHHRRLQELVVRSDGLADGLLREADRVAQANRAAARITELERQVSRREQQLAELTAEAGRLAARWQALWAKTGLTVNASAGVMCEWHQQAQQLRADAGRLQQQLADQASTLTGGRRLADHVRRELANLKLSADGELPVPQLIEQAKAALAEIQRQRDAEQAAQTELQRLHDEYAASRDAQAAAALAVTEWQRRWQAAVSVRPSIDPDAPPAKTRETVARINELAGKQRELAQLAAGRASDERERDDARAALLALCAAAGCEQVQDLPEIERRATQRDELRRALADCEREIVQHGERTISELEAELAGRDGDQLAAELADDERQLREAREHYDELGSRGAAARAERDHLDTGSAAALAREAAERDGAEIAELAERYLAAVSASTLLGAAIAHHREDNASPILRRASELLGQLTNGSLSALVLDDQASAKPVIRARRGNVDGTPVTAALDVAELSEGTRDQLYLALRLAALEHQLQAREPQPLLLDDVLVSYDEPRVAAALRAFASVARRTQVILFTHHQHVATIAAEVLGDQVRVHQLG